MSLFQDDDWFRKLLEDDDILSELGLPTNLDEKDIEKLISEIESNPILMDTIQSIEEELANPTKYDEMDLPFDENKSPAKQFIEEAMLDIGSTINTKESLETMEVGKSFMIIFPNKKVITVRLENIVESKMGLDFLFYNISGADDLIKLTEQSGKYDVGLFPIPQQFLFSTIIRELS